MCSPPPNNTLLLLIFIFLYITSAAVSVTISDNLTMDALLSSVTPTPSGWSSATHFCDWRGVECDTKNRVISLTLPSQSLSGELPPSLNSLTRLTTLSLQNNRFSGPLPSFANLSRLRKLYLHNNLFTSIPTAAFSGLISLQILSISNNTNLSPWHFPSELASSPKMVALQASNANIVGSIPDIFMSFPLLVNLILSYNNLTGSLPGSFNGSGIQELKLDNQKTGLTGNIDILFGMNHLSVVWLNGNNFSGVLPSSFVSLPNLTHARLDRNNFIAPIPPIPHLSKNVVVDFGTITPKYLPRNEYDVGPFSFRRWKIFIRADVEPPPANSSSWFKTNVGAIAGLKVYLVFVILVFFVWISWSVSEGGAHQQQVVVQPRVQRTENPQQVEIVQQQQQQQQRPLPPRDGVVRRREGKQPLSSPPPPGDGDMRRREAKQPQPSARDRFMRPTEDNRPQPQQAALARDRVVRLREETQPQQTAPSRDRVMRPREENQPQQVAPAQDRVMRPREENQPQPHQARERLLRPREENQPQQAAPARDRVTRPREEKQPQSQQAAPPRDRVMRRGDRIQLKPPPPSPRDGILRRNEERYQQQQPLDIDEVARRRKSIREGKRPQQHKQDPRDEEVDRQNKKDRDGKQTNKFAKDNENSLGLPNKYTYEYLMSVTKDFHSSNKIGEGDYGIVYKGTLSDGTTMVAVKCFNARGIIKDFKNEVESLGRTDHPNLVKLLGYCAEKNVRILVYEYMKNRSLEKWIFHAKARRYLTWPVMKNIIRGIAQGLEHLHENCYKKILHRDLMPSNVLLDGNMNAKLCDFGMAKLLDKDQSSTMTVWSRAHRYMAPEVKEGKNITEKVDVYSFGIVVLEVLFGERYYKLVEQDQDGLDVTQLPDLINKKLSVEMRKSTEEIETIGRLALLCLNKEPGIRPTLSMILVAVEYLDENS